MLAYLDPLDPETYPEEIDTFAAFCREILVLDNGEPMILHKYQRRMLAPFFAGAGETIIEMPKGNAKTTTLAALCLFHLLTTTNAECLVSALTVEQADTLGKQIRIFIQGSEELQARIEFKQGTRQFRNVEDQGRIWIRVGDRDKVDGSIPSLWIIEEWHLFSHEKDPRFIYSKGARKRGGQGLVISTAGADRTGPLGKMLETARNWARRYVTDPKEEAYACYVNETGNTWVQEWALDPAAHDLMSVDHALLCNPAPWITRELLLEDHPDQGGSADHEWLRYVVGQWIAGYGALFTAHTWGQYADRTPIPNGTLVRAGLDLGATHDSSALAWMTWENGGAVRRFATAVFEPVGDGSRFDNRAIEVAIAVLAGKLDFDRQRFVTDLTQTNDADAVNRWADTIEGLPRLQVASLTFDPYNADDLVQRVERKYKIPAYDMNQNGKSIVRVSQRFMDAFHEGRVRHNGDALLEAHALAVVENPTGNSYYIGRPKKAKERKDTDALMAAIYVHDTMVAEDGVEAPKPERRRPRWVGV